MKFGYFKKSEVADILFLVTQGSKMSFLSLHVQWLSRYCFLRLIRLISSLIRWYHYQINRVLALIDFYCAAKYERATTNESFDTLFESSFT